MPGLCIEGFLGDVDLHYSLDQIGKSVPSSFYVPAAKAFPQKLFTFKGPFPIQSKTIGFQPIAAFFPSLRGSVYQCVNLLERGQHKRKQIMELFRAHIRFRATAQGESEIAHTFLALACSRFRLDHSGQSALLRASGAIIPLHEHPRPGVDLMLESVRENGIYKTMRRYKSFLPYLSLLILTALAFFTGYLARAAWPPPGEELYLLREAKRLLEAHYLDPLPESIELERGMIRGMVDTLDDPFTTLVDPAVHELQRDDLSGEYGGIGAIITRDESRLVHLAPFEDSPAERAGIEEGDTLHQVDDLVINVQTRLEEISAAIRGPLGSEVTLLVSKTEDSEDASEIRILRESIPLPSVTSYAHPDDPTVGVIAITIFSEKTPGEVEEHFSSLRQEGMTALVLDLRDNSGGLLDSAIEVARFFLDDGLILKEIQSEGKIVEHSAESPGEGASIPLSVLVNGGTASAAEIVAGALQANGRAALVGQKTFGKGSVQLVFELRDGSSLHVTSARWLTANGIALDQRGLKPDIPLDSEAETTDIILQKALEALRDSNED